MPPTTLIIVCCHGIYLGGPNNGHSESEWLIAPFQCGETPTFIEHVRAGISCLSRDDDAVLVFSGGPTRKETSLSEAQSYANIAQANSYFGLNPPQERILLEERALDSYHNILFSLTLFFGTYSTWPSKVTIVTHAFKKPRILGHCRAIAVEGVEIAGIDPPGLNGQEDGVAKAVGEWGGDPHGCGISLRGKRDGRNPWGVWQGVWKDGPNEGGMAGLKTRGEGREETLVEDAVRPWA